MGITALRFTGGFLLTSCASCSPLFGMAPPQAIVILFLSDHHFLVPRNVPVAVERPWICCTHAAVNACGCSAWPSQRSGAGKGEDLQGNRDMPVLSTVSFGIFHRAVVLMQGFVL